MKDKRLWLLAWPMIILTNSCITPEYAASDTCDCLHETATKWRRGDKMDAFLQFVDCGQKQEEYKKQFSGQDLIRFNTAYDECLGETIKGEMLLYFLDK